MQYNYLVVEDDPSFSLELEMLIDELDGFLVAKVDNAASALEQILQHKIDLIIMDIQIKGDLTGLELSERIANLRIPTIFISGLDDDEVYQKTVELEAVAYLVKPISKYSLMSAFKLAHRLLEVKAKTTALLEGMPEKSVLDDFIFFKKNGSYEKIELGKIILLEGSGDYTLVHLNDGDEFLSRLRLKDLVNVLPARAFMQVHRSFIVQLAAIESINFKENVLSLERVQIPISKRYKGALQEAVRKIW